MSYYKPATRKTTTAKIPSENLRNQQHQQIIEQHRQQQSAMAYTPMLLKEDGDQKIPLFLVKLWNIVEDPAHWEVIRWDEVRANDGLFDEKHYTHSNILSDGTQFSHHEALCVLQ